MVITSRLSYRPWWRVVLAKATTYLELLKFRLSLLVAFSAGFGFLLGSRGDFDSMNLLMLCLGGFLVSGCSIALNQIIERDYDKLMNRTKNRPLPSQTYCITSWFFCLVDRYSWFVVTDGVHQHAYRFPFTGIFVELRLDIYPFKKGGTNSSAGGCFSWRVSSIIGMGSCHRITEFCWMVNLWDPIHLAISPLLGHRLDSR